MKQTAFTSGGFTIHRNRKNAPSPRRNQACILPSPFSSPENKAFPRDPTLRVALKIHNTETGAIR